MSRLKAPTTRRTPAKIPPANTRIDPNHNRLINGFVLTPISAAMRLIRPAVSSERKPGQTETDPPEKTQTVQTYHGRVAIPKSVDGTTEEEQK